MKTNNFSLSKKRKLNKIMIVSDYSDILEIERLLEKSDRKRKLEKRKLKKLKKRNYKSKFQIKDQPLTEQQISQEQQVSISTNIILPFIKLLLDKNLITFEELQTLKLKEDNPLNKINFKIEDKILDKSECRQYWLYLMRNNELYCALCGHPIKDTKKGPWRLTAEHTVPKSLGGASNSTNLVPAHEICNNIKTNIIPEEWEKVGLQILKSYGIHVDTKHSMYKYMKEIQR